MAKCAKCGIENPGGRDWCFNCGAALTGEEYIPPPRTAPEAPIEPVQPGPPPIVEQSSYTPPPVAEQASYTSPPAAQQSSYAAPAAAATIMTADNTSGDGASAVVPMEIRGWNWGAFLLHWIWGIGNHVWLALLVFVPFVNVVMMFMLGAKGSEWAWQNRRFEGGVEEFRKVQRAWAKWGLILILVQVAMGILLVVVAAEMKSGITQMQGQGLGRQNGGVSIRQMGGKSNAELNKEMDRHMKVMDKRFGTQGSEGSSETAPPSK